ncbi:unnamed protein product [Rhodiola kirilowii]
MWELGGRRVKILISRDVTFNERSFPYKENAPNPELAIPEPELLMTIEVEPPDHLGNTDNPATTPKPLPVDQPVDEPENPGHELVDNPEPE